MAEVPEPIEPMLATTDGGELPDHPRYCYEYKWDGYRACLRVAADGSTRLNSRNDNDFTAAYPELHDAFTAALGGTPAVIDGEVVALNDAGRPEFRLLQDRRLRTRPVAYFAFDLLRLGDTVLLDRPYWQRRELLEQLTPADPNRAVIPPSYAHADLAARDLTPQGLLDIAAQTGLEGLLAKDRESRYHPGRRSPEWLKHPLITAQEVIIGGWRPGQGRRAGTLGALLLGAHDRSSGELRYVGDVGTGFTDRALRAMQETLAPLEQSHSPFADQVPRDRARGAHWVAPRLVGEVVYRQFTADGRLRHTAWRGLRPDRRPAEVLAPAPR